MCKSFSSEQEFLLSLLKYSLLKKPDNFLYPSDNNFIVDQAQYHNIIPLVALALNNISFEKLNENILEKINDLNREVAVKNLYLINELIEINNIFNSNELNFVLLKGPALGTELYEDINLRQIGDLDLLVKKEKIDEAVKILLQRGYRCFFKLTDRQRKVYENSAIYLIDHDMHYSFFHPQKNIFVELHWALMPEKYSFCQNTSEIFKRKKIVEISGYKIYTLNDEDLIIFLSLHGAKHGWSRLFWLCDIVRFLIMKKSLDWTYVLNRAEALNCSRSLYVALNISEYIAPGLIPGSLQEIIKKDKKVVRISGIIRENMFNSDHKIELKNKNIIFVSSMEHYLDKLRFYYDKLFQPTIYEVEIINLPKKLFFIYYILRPIRLLTMYTLRLISN